MSFIGRLSSFRGKMYLRVNIKDLKCTIVSFVWRKVRFHCTTFKTPLPPSPPTATGKLTPELGRPSPFLSHAFLGTASDELSNTKKYHICSHMFIHIHTFLLVWVKGVEALPVAHVTCVAVEIFTPARM